MWTDRDLLLTPAALADAGVAGFDVVLNYADDPVLEQEMRAAVAHAQEAVAGVWGSHPLAHAVAQPVPYAPYLTVPDGRPFVFADGRPVVEVFTADAVAYGAEIHLGASYLGTYGAAPGPRRPALSYAAGWRGEHHTLGDGGANDLNGRDGLAALAVLPDLVPGDVRSVLVEVALIELDRRRGGKLGGRATIVSIGEGQVQTDAYAPDAERIALSRLAPRHRRVRL